jgi:signal transduction histidine kinase
MPTQVSDDGIAGPILLPCPAVDLIELAVADAQQPLRLQQLLRFNPSLMVFGLAAFHAANQTAPDSFGQLSQWCQANLLERFAGLPDGWSEIETSLDVANRSHGDPVSGKALREFVATRTNGQIRKWLTQFVVSATGVPKKPVKKWVNQLIGKDLTFQKLKHLNRLSAHKLPRKRLAQKWKHSRSDAADIESVFRMSQDSKTTERQFQARLTREKLASLKELAYGASHEINNPLANISIRAQTLLNTESDPERRQKLAVIYEQALRAHEMISDLMLFANPPASGIQSIDLRLWIPKLVTEISPSLTRLEINGLRVEQLPIEFEVRLGPEVRHLDVDPTQLSVAIKSLIRNSIESIRTAARSGNISLRVSQSPAGWIGFTVTDDGGGVLDCAKPHLFDPFYSSRESGRGLGFGLSKAWRIAELHGGTLELNGQHEPGAQFTLLIPLSRMNLSPTTTVRSNDEATPLSQKRVG